MAKGKKKGKGKAKNAPAPPKAAAQPAPPAAASAPASSTPAKPAKREEDAKPRKPKGPLQERLRTPAGQLWLLLAALVVSIPIGVALGLNRRTFEGFARERYPQAPETAIRVADAIARGQAGAAQVRELDLEGRCGLYRLWMRQDPEVAGPVDGNAGDQLPPKPVEPLLRPEVLGPLLFEVDPACYADLLKRTLVAGSPAQRERALLLARQARGPALAAVLRFAAERAARTRDPQAPLLREALAGVAPRTSSG
ncbi:MAG: hypothetical protein AB7N76_02575 [Planctomycetota bacterium]